ncbi:diguanylate cyclase [Agaribacter flavus]|uniref:diguanylate cyclase n=1 Tax=Agaribacter flavus TaxID=1902781 RepID=A0ABV7FQP3_9ALTE
MYKQRILRQFSFSILLTMGLFTAVISLTLNSLWELKNSYNNLSNERLPRLSKTNTLHHQIERLITLSKSLTESKNEPERQITMSEIEGVLLGINRNVDTASNAFLSRQMSVLSREVNELNALIIDKIQSTGRLFEQEQHLVETISIATTERKLSALEQKKLTELLLHITQIHQQTRINKIRKIQSDISTLLKTFPSSSANNQVFDVLGEHLLEDTGYIQNKIESLRIIGRARGRGNFVANLVKDVANTLEFQSRKTMSESLKESAEVSRAIESITHTNTIIVLVSIVISLLAIYLLYKRIVLRLVDLSKDVELASNDEIDEVASSGNDEITKLADNVNNFLNKVKEQEKTLLALSRKDPLTGIANRRAFESTFESMMAQAKRQEWNLSLVLVDVDYFKKYNDEYGHAEGDACLRLVANQLNETLTRSTDFTARYGGEEFVCLLPNTNIDTAKKKTEDLIQAILQLDIPHSQSPHGRVTVSAGVATFPFNKTSNWPPETIIEQADKALYRAKDKGRNTMDAFKI